MKKNWSKLIRKDRNVPFLNDSRTFHPNLSNVEWFWMNHFETRSRNDFENLILELTGLVWVIRRSLKSRQMWKDGWGQNVSFGRQMNFFCQNGKVETGPSSVKSIHVNIWFQWNRCEKWIRLNPGISLWFNQGTIHRVKMFEISIANWHW